jgi:multimeric flavodoxin WrbA
MKYVLGINGSPRKSWNTATLISHALDGAESVGAKTELVHLYDLSFKGCVSCFRCKRKDYKGPWRCLVEDALAPVLEKAEKADALVIGSPIYIGEMTSSTRAFIERYLFPFVSYDAAPPTRFTGKVSIGIICPMGATAEASDKAGFAAIPERTAAIFKRIVGSGESIASVDTLQFDDYGKYAASRFNPVEKARIRKEIFPTNCQRAFDMGVRFGT